MWCSNLCACACVHPRRWVLGGGGGVYVNVVLGDFPFDMGWGGGKPVWGGGGIKEAMGGTILATTLLCANHVHRIHQITNNATAYLFVYVCMFE